jgi:hypothetical protein
MRAERLARARARPPGLAAGRANRAARGSWSTAMPKAWAHGGPWPRSRRQQKPTAEVPAHLPATRAGRLVAGPACATHARQRLAPPKRVFHGTPLAPVTTLEGPRRQAARHPTSLLPVSACEQGSTGCGRDRASRPRVRSTWRGPAQRIHLGQHGPHVRLLQNLPRRPDAAVVVGQARAMGQHKVQAPGIPPRQAQECSRIRRAQGGEVQDRHGGQFAGRQKALPPRRSVQGLGARRQAQQDNDGEGGQAGPVAPERAMLTPPHSPSRKPGQGAALKKSHHAASLVP